MLTRLPNVLGMRTALCAAIVAVLVFTNVGIARA
jgi:hypothetical protein